MGGGSYCAIVGCSAVQQINRGLSFHSLPKRGKFSEWRKQLILKINRCDKGFNPNNAKICSRHFKESCFIFKMGANMESGRRSLIPGSMPTLWMPQRTAHGDSKPTTPKTSSPLGFKRTLIPGSLPTEFMPSRSIVTPPLKERKPPLPRDPPAEVKRVCYFNLEDLKKDAAKMSLPWILLDSNDSSVNVGTVENLLVKLSVTISPDLCTSVSVFGMPVPCLSKNIESLRLKTYLTELAALHSCPGVTIPPVKKYSNLPSVRNKAKTHFLHVSYNYTAEGFCASTCVRSKECLLLLSEEGMCANCKATEKRLLLRKKNADIIEMQPLKPQDSLHNTSKKRLKSALKELRKSEKKLRVELEQLKKKAENPVQTGDICNCFENTGWNGKPPRKRPRSTASGSISTMDEHSYTRKLAARCTTDKNKLSSGSNSANPVVTCNVTPIVELGYSGNPGSVGEDHCNTVKSDTTSLEEFGNLRKPVTGNLTSVKQNSCALNHASWNFTSFKYNCTHRLISFNKSPFKDHHGNWVESELELD